MEPKNSLINARLLLWHDSKDNWAISTKIPMLGEPCIEQDGSNIYMKIGDGIHKFKDLNYITTKIVDETNDIRIDNLENNIIEISNRVNNIENGNMTTIEPTLLDIPVIYFSGDSLPTTKDSKMLKFRYVSNTNAFSGYVKIKCQGTSSMRYNKKNFTITMYDDEALTIKKTMDFKHWGEQSKFVLKANWIDLTHARNIVSARIWGDIVKSRPDYEDYPELLKTSPNQGAIDGFPVKVFSDGVYYGRYTLNIPKDGWMANMNSDSDIQCILCGENFKSGLFREEAKIDGSDWSDELHDTVPESIKTKWNEIITFIRTSNDIEFRNNISNYFYINSLFDYLLYGLVSCGLDAFGKNQLYFTYDNNKWIASMYDMDSTWGLYWNGASFVTSYYARTDFEDYKNNYGGNLLYNRIWILFQDELRKRYIELRRGSLSVTNLVNHFEKFCQIASNDLIKEDYANTTANGSFMNIPSSTTNNIQQIRKYIVDRLAYVDEYMGGLDPIPATDIELSQETISFDIIKPIRLTAIVTPSNTTDNIRWESTDITVATVTDGLVTPISQGECTIIVRCGDVFETCACVVNIEESIDIMYQLDEPVVFDGKFSIDTGIQLRLNNDPWSFVIEFTPTEPLGNTTTVLHCMHEVLPWHGINIQIQGGVYSYYHKNKYLNPNGKGVQNNDSSVHKWVVAHSGTLTKVYSSLDAFGEIENTSDPVYEPLRLGGYTDINGNPGRFWKGTMSQFILYNRVLTYAEIQAIYGVVGADAEISAESEYTPIYSEDVNLEDMGPSITE